MIEALKALLAILSVFFVGQFFDWLINSRPVERAGRYRIDGYRHHPNGWWNKKG